MEHLAVILTGLFTLISGVIVAWFAYNQRTKDKMTDLKIEKIQQDNAEKAARDNRNSAIVYGELWKLLHRLDVDRCFVLQPHPKEKHRYLSVFFEVDKNGISPVKEILMNIPMSQIPQFSEEISVERWLFYTEIDKQVLDKRVRSFMQLGGASNVAVKVLENAEGSWIGNLFVENTTNKKFIDNEDIIKQEMKNTANIIQYIMPLPIN